MDEQRELASDLVRSPARIEILRRLRDGLATRYDLREALDCARTTVDRNIERLHEDGWIAASGEGYELTTSGEIVLEQVEAYLDTVGAAARLQPILQWLPREAFDLDVRHLDDAEIVVATESQPMAMVDRHARAVASSPEMRMVTPVFSPQPLEAQFRNFELSELDIEVVVPATVASTFVSESPAVDPLTEMREAGVADVFVTEESIPYFVGVLGELVQIGVDEDGQPRGLLESENERVREWAHETIEEYRRAGEPLADWRAAR